MTAQELIVTLEDKPGSLARLGETLGAAGLNIEGLCGVPSVTTATVHLLVRDTASAKSALQQAGFTVQGERSVLVLELEDRPGELGRLARRMASAGVNITLVYLASGTRLVLGVDDIDKAQAALTS